MELLLVLRTMPEERENDRGNIRGRLCGGSEKISRRKDIWCKGEYARRSNAARVLSREL